MDMASISKDVVRIRAEACSWQDAIRTAGNLLMENGCVEECYIDAMIKSMVEHGPYFVLAPGVALPHAASGSGVRRTGMSVVTLARPVEFMESPNNPVELVICLAAADGESHLDLLASLSELLMDAEALECVKGADDPEDVLRAFSAKSKVACGGEHAETGR